LGRTRELYENKAASGKDLLDSETEAKQNQAAMNDSESRLRQTGFNMKLLMTMKPGSVFIVADVPEPRIGAVDMGEPAYIEFNSFTGKTFYGKVISIGDVIDPQTRTIKVGMGLSNKDGRIKPGMF